jgi:hypothetical protein
MAEREFNRDPKASTLWELLDRNELIEETLGHFPYFHLVHGRAWEDLLAYLDITWTDRRPFHVLFRGVEFFRIHPGLDPDNTMPDVHIVELPGINLEHMTWQRPSFFQDRRPINETDIFVE